MAANHNININDIQILSALVDESPDPIGVYVGQDMHIRVANKAIHKLWDKPPSVVGKKLAEVMPELEGNEFFKLIDQVYTSGTPYKAKQAKVDLLIGGKIKTHYLDFEFTPLKDEQGNVWGILDTAKDLTDVVLEKNRLREADERLKFTLDAAGIGNWDRDLLSDEVWWDERCKQIFGLRPTEKIYYQHIIDHIYPADRPMVAEAVKDAHNPKLKSIYDIKYRILAGESKIVKWIQSKGKAYFNSSDQPVRFAGIVQDITKQVEAEEKIKSAEHLAQLAVEAAGSGTFVVNIVTNQAAYSPQFIKIVTGTNLQYGSHEELARFIHPEDVDVRKAAVQNAIETGKLKYEVRVVWDDGSIHWIRTFGGYTFDHAGNPLMLMGTTQDITEEVENREQQRRLLWLLENANDFVCLADWNGDITYINKAGIEMLGFKNLEQALRPNSEYLMPSELERLKNEVLPAVKNTGRWEGDVLLKNFTTGNAVPGHVNILLWRDGITGKPLGRASVVRDLRPDIAARKALADSEELFRGITTASPTALWMSDSDGKITYVNQIWIDWTGLPLEVHIEQGWLSAVVKDDVEKAVKRYLDNFADRKFHDAEFRIKHKDGTIRWIMCTGNPQYNSDRVFTGYIGACADITEQKQLQEQKDQFIGIASHELKTPVTSIKAYSQVIEALLRRGGDERKADMVGKLTGQVDRLDNLIGDLLNITKIQTGRLEFDKAEFDLNLLVTEAAEEMQRTTPAHKIITNLMPLPHVLADRERVNQVLTNFISNAIKYSPNGGEISIYTKLLDSEVQVCVEDNGIGISPDIKDRVFEQFYRVTGDAQHTFPGLGLGLYIAAEIIKRQEGRIWVNSVYGEGSGFYFTLPVM